MFREEGWSYCAFLNTLIVILKTFRSEDSKYRKKDPSAQALQDDTIVDMSTVPRSKQFDDVYFSAENGLAETRHVFLDGNGLPDAWAGKDHFTIFETGFGTGLNFLAVWKLFEEGAAQGQTLRFVSVEKFPLGKKDIGEALKNWGELDQFRECLVEVYPDDPSGVFLADVNKRVSVEVHFGDANDVMPALEMDVDAWFLDGFKPSSNPEMWSEAVFAAMGRMSHAGSSFATFTSAGFVRRGLEAAGFDVRKVPGYGRKREMSVGVYQ